MIRSLGVCRTHNTPGGRKAFTVRGSSGSLLTCLLQNTIDWIGAPAFPLVKEYVTANPDKMTSRRGRTSILGHIMKVNGL